MVKSLLDRICLEKMFRLENLLDYSKCHSSTNPLRFSHDTQDIGTQLHINPERTAIPYLFYISLHKGTAILLLVLHVMELFNSQ